MKRVQDAQVDFQEALYGIVEQLPEERISDARRAVEPFVASLVRKCRCVLTHRDVINSVNWNKLGEIGRQASIDGRRETLEITLPDARLTICHPEVVKDHVYMAFDGLVSGLVNATDTLARIVNTCFDLGLDPLRTNLLQIGREVSHSPIGAILSDSARTSWLSAVRKLRGRCQHADLEDVLENSCLAYGRSAEPRVHADYTWSDPPLDTPVSTYVSRAVEHAQILICDCIAAIVEFRMRAVQHG